MAIFRGGSGSPTPSNDVATYEEVTAARDAAATSAAAAAASAAAAATSEANAATSEANAKATVDVAGFIDVVLANADMIVFATSRAYDVPAGATNSQGYCGTAPSGGSVVFDLQKNGVSFGSMTFADGAQTATFSVATLTSFAIGDRLSVVAPADVRSMDDLSFNIRCAIT